MPFKYFLLLFDTLIEGWRCSYLLTKTGESQGQDLFFFFKERFSDGITFHLSLC